MFVPLSPRVAHRRASALRLLAAAAVLGGLLGLAPIGLAQLGVFAKADETTQLRISPKAYGATQTLNMNINKSLIVDLPVDAQEVIVSSPGVASAILRSKRRAIVQATGSGDTNIFMLDDAGKPITILDISVRGEVSTVAAALRETYAKVLPTAHIDVASVVLRDADGNETNRVVLSGYAATTDDVTKAVSIATQFAGDEKNVASVISVGGPQQVMLKVTVAEVSREAVKQLGLDLTGSFGSGVLTTGIVSSQPLGGATNVITGSKLTAGIDVGNLSLDATLRAMERHGALRTLAEPTLTSMSGSEAEFLAGGEFPVPTDVDTGGKITYTFKEFGVKLKFTPTIKSKGTIGLVVDTSVSEPTTEGGFTVGNITIPATKNRQAKTTVELAAGQTLSIGGLMQDSVRQQINSLPGLGDIPILGTLFRSRDFIHSQTELVILVTPYYATPTDQAPATPVDQMDLANDAEAIFLGRIERMYGVGSGGMRGSYDGSIGFVLD